MNHIHYDIPDMVEKINEYIESKKKGFPILKECCLENNWPYSTFMRLQKQYPELKEASERLLTVKEVALEKGGLTGKFNISMVIFSLKQLGWTDQVKVDVDIEERTEGVDELENFFKERQQAQSRVKPKGRKQEVDS